MKKLLLLLVMLASFFMVSCESCERQVCDLAKQGADTFSTNLATRWECNKDKIYAFVMTPIEKTVCKDEPLPQTIWTDTICPMVLNSAAALGAEEVVTRYECNLEKVQADFNNIPEVCKLLPQ